MRGSENPGVLGLFANDALAQNFAISNNWLITSVLYYNTTIGAFRYWDGAAWQPFGGQSTDVNTSGIPTLGPIDLINGTDISITRPSPGKVQIAASPTGGQAEKPWEYHDLHNFPVSNNTRKIEAHNGVSSQRCITKGADGRVYILWGDNAFFDDFGWMRSLYLTIFYANTATGAWDTITYQILMHWGEQVILYPKPYDFCIVMDQGVQPDGEMLHILFSAETSSDPEIVDVFDAYYPTSSIGRPPSAQITLLDLYPERVNQIVAENYQCSQVAGAYQALLSAGPGIVVVWKQYDDDVGADIIKSNIYDPTQAIFSRYLVGATAYRECRVNDTFDANCPSIECTANACHCCYLEYDNDTGSYLPFYSNLKPTGQETNPNVWDNIMLTANGSIDSKSSLPSYNGFIYTSMVVLFDGQISVQQDVIILATRSQDRDNNLYVYAFSQDIVTLPAPTLIRSDIANVYDESKPNTYDRAFGFQLGLTSIVNSPIVGSVVPEVLIYIEVGTARGWIFDKDFALLHRSYNTLGLNGDEPFYHTPLKCSVGDVSRGLDNEVRFHPTVHFSNMYMQGGWNTVANAPWFPYNAYHNIIPGTYTIPYQDAAIVPFDVMIINQKPAYRM